MKAVLEAITKLNAVTVKEGGKEVPWLAAPIDIDSLKGMGADVLKEAYMEAVEVVLEKNQAAGALLPKELGDLYNTYAGTAGEDVQPAVVPEKPAAVEKKKSSKVVEKKAVVQKKEAVKKAPDKKVKAELMIVDEIENDFTIDNCPTEYVALKAQAKKLALASATSFLLLGQRLKVIRDGEGYKEDGYKTFKDFVSGEIKISRATAYNYIDLIDFFGVQSLGQANACDPSKLIPALPLMKANEEKISKADKKDLKATLLKEAKTKSAKEMTDEIKGLKVKYGLVAEKEEVDKLDACFDRLVSLLPEKLNAVDKTKIKRYIKKLQGFVE